MKKQFRNGEIIRKRFTLQYGVVEGVFYENEYYCTFDGCTLKYDVSELSYGVLKQLYEWLKDDTGENYIDYLFTGQSIQASIKRFFLGLVLIAVFMVVVGMFNFLIK